MGKPWARYEIDFIDHPKFLMLTANAICLWIEGKNYSDMYLTDGYIPRSALKTFRFRGKKSEALLLQSAGQKREGTPYAPLWEEVTLGASAYIRMHDYLDHNDCRETVLARIEASDERDERSKERNRRRQAIFRDDALTDTIRARDGNTCRYCGRDVAWLDRRGPNGGTYDHVDPDGPNSLDNLVVACRGCNSAKGRRLPSDAGMALRPAPVSTPDLKRIQNRVNTTETTTESETESEVERKKEQEKSAPPLPGKQPPLQLGLRRFKVWRWMLDECIAALGAHADGFDLDSFLRDLDQRETRVIEDVWPWLRMEVLAEARRRSLPMAVAPVAPQVGKQTARLAAAVANIRATEGLPE